MYVQPWQRCHGLIVAELLVIQMASMQVLTKHTISPPQVAARCCEAPVDGVPLLFGLVPRGRHEYLLVCEGGPLSFVQESVAHTKTNIKNASKECPAACATTCCWEHLGIFRVNLMSNS